VLLTPLNSRGSRPRHSGVVPDSLLRDLGFESTVLPPPPFSTNFPPTPTFNYPNLNDFVSLTPLYSKGTRPRHSGVAPDSFLRDLGFESIVLPPSSANFPPTPITPPRRPRGSNVISDDTPTRSSRYKPESASTSKATGPKTMGHGLLTPPKSFNLHSTSPATPKRSTPAADAYPTPPAETKRPTKTKAKKTNAQPSASTAASPQTRSNAPPSSIPVPESWSAAESLALKRHQLPSGFKLMKHQILGRVWMANVEAKYGGGLICDDMG
jgi:hypothetical protein